MHGRFTAVLPRVLQRSAAVLAAALVAAPSSADFDPRAPDPQAAVPTAASPAAAGTARAEKSAPGENNTRAAIATPAAPAGKPTLRAFGSLRVREEVWDWFGHLGGREQYAFTGSLLRFGAAYQSPNDDLTFELAQPTLLGLPRDASLGAPLGQLGLGAAYRDANGSLQANIFIKQGYWLHRGLGGGPGARENSLKVGQFEFIDGTETTPTDASLAWMKRERIAHRLIGNFAWSDVQRSYDGGQFTHNTPHLNITAFGAMPTAGVFDLDGNPTLEEVKVGYASATTPLSGKRFAGEARLFGIHYRDERPGVVKTDNRPLAARKGDTGEIAINTVGGHWLGVRDLGTGKADGLFWGALQWGDWGKLDHGALAFSAEAGYQPKNTWGQPWFRAGYSHFSGDGNGNNGEHGTFFPILPTPRIYARFPFYTEMNLNDAFLQAILKPRSKVTVRSDLHFLSLASADDLWYSGGGAFQDQPGFGYSGRPSSGKTDLGMLADISVDYQVRKNTTLSAYFGYASGGDVQERIYKKGGGAFLGYLEFTQRW